MTKKALITGITGQTGSYLAEILLDKDYEVYGLVRRSSTNNLGRIMHILNKVHIVRGDMTDQTSLDEAVRGIKPDEIYNLAAQSYVHDSWNQPFLTMDVTGIGTIRILEAIRKYKPDTRFVQASSSEMFGNIQESPQTEKTPFWPRSPYGCAKVLGHWVTVNARESWGAFACSAIFFNMECISSDTPLIIREHGIVRVVQPTDIIGVRGVRSPYGGSSKRVRADLDGLEIWDGRQWTPILTVVATRRRSNEADHELLGVSCRGGFVTVTTHHRMLDADMKVLYADQVSSETRLALGRYPNIDSICSTQPEMAELLGYLVSEGRISKEGNTDVTCNDEEILSRVADLWRRLFLGTAIPIEGKSGITGKPVKKMRLNGGNKAWIWLRRMIYTVDGFKRIPEIILNAPEKVRDAFLCGYYAGDGLKAGSGEAFGTNSPVLAQGLCWLYYLKDQPSSIYFRPINSSVNIEPYKPQPFYQVNLGSTNCGIGQHLRKDAQEVRKIYHDVPNCEWVFDIETESGVFMAGVGRLVVHNSERRGLEFVTRKITHVVARIKHGLQKDLHLGNLNAIRDWGYACEYAMGMYLMLQQDDPDDFVFATGLARTVKTWLETAFRYAGLNWQDYVVIDESLKRPAEVDLLLGDASKAKRILGWEPKIHFEEIVKRMVDADMELVGKSK